MPFQRSGFARCLTHVKGKEDNAVRNHKRDSRSLRMMHRDIEKMNVKSRRLMSSLDFSEPRAYRDVPEEVVEH
jgi:hypothetical protein